MLKIVLNVENLIEYKLDVFINKYKNKFYNLILRVILKF